MLSWASRFNICCFLDNHLYEHPSHSIECLLGVGDAGSVRAQAGNAFDQLEEFTAHHRDWLFGHLGYDLAAETEPAPAGGMGQAMVAGAISRLPTTEGTSRPGVPGGTVDPIGFPDLFFFIPLTVIELSNTWIRIGCLGTDPAAVWETILREVPAPPRPGAARLAPFQPRFSREEYLDTIQALRQHILRGDCYEINFCQEFFSHPARIDPLQTWLDLSKVSPSPFSAFYRIDEKYLLCASPERYLRRTGDTLVSQPIKGTSPRFPGDLTADMASRAHLYESAKDRSENVMVVDLVRNDLSRICLPDSVRVEELYGIYSFPQVHQMISTIRGQLAPGTGFAAAIRATFPMGSMTGAPKNRVVGLIRQYERTRRGIFSGAVGYCRPEGDFDLNVVIRSILYNQAGSYLSYLVGSGITFYSDPVLEYQECMMKAEGMKKALRMGEGPGNNI